MNEITLPTLNKVSLKKPISIAFSICVLFHILLYLCFQIFEPLEIVGEIIILALKLLVFYIAGVCANDTFIKTHQKAPEQEESKRFALYTAFLCLIPALVFYTAKLASIHSFLATYGLEAHHEAIVNQVIIKSVIPSLFIGFIAAYFIYYWSFSKASKKSLIEKTSS